MIDGVSPGAHTADSSEGEGGNRAAMSRWGPCHRGLEPGLWGGGAVSTHGAHCAGCPGHPFELFHSAATNGPEGVVVGQASGLGTS